MYFLRKSLKGKRKLDPYQTRVRDLQGEETSCINSWGSEEQGMLRELKGKDTSVAEAQSTQRRLELRGNRKRRQMLDDGRVQSFAQEMGSHLTLLKRCRRRQWTYQSTIYMSDNFIHMYISYICAYTYMILLLIFLYFHQHWLKNKSLGWIFKTD